MTIGDCEVPEWVDDADHDDGEPEVVDDESLVLDLPPLRGRPMATSAHGPVPRHQHKRELRARNAERARDIARRSGLAHAHVNIELNRMAGVRRITEATLEQLDRRARAAAGWLARL